MALFIQDQLVLCFLQFLGGYKQFGELPYASSLCGACTETCPVKNSIARIIN